MQPQSRRAAPASVRTAAGTRRNAFKVHLYTVETNEWKVIIQANTANLCREAGGGATRSRVAQKVAFRGGELE